MEKPVFRNDTPLGQVDDWPSSLQMFSAFVCTLPHPAAIYWGEELVILQNEAWERTFKSKEQQGKAQKEQLDEKALTSFNDALSGHVQHDVTPSLFVNGQEDIDKQFHLLLSPISDNASTETPGIIAQLLPTEKGSHENGTDENTPKAAGSEAGKKERGTNMKKRAFEQNPFFQHIAEMLPAGIAILNHEAEAIFINQHFYELTSSQQQPNDFKSWPTSIHPDDHDRVIQGYHDAFKSGKDLRCEFRVLDHEEQWRLLLVTPVGDDGLRQQSLEEFGGFLCVVVDITPNKAQELAQKKAAIEAQERKEQQERFIDMISHEIRNPLSAVLHCAEDITEACHADLIDDASSQRVLVSTAIVDEAVETIKLCVHHQKNIVDDILSFSKLDSSMMSLVPKSVQPKTQLAQGLKMFQPELRKQHIEFEYAIDVSYEDTCKVDWVKADLMRISQVVVNLVNNAVKFTERKEGNKKISVGVGASRVRPTSYPPNVVFFDTDNTGFRLDGTNTIEWGNGETLYIMVAVKDTGIGISQENQAKLFERFRQATPKTESEYGGSGLGLNISRKICQLHGGEIGVASKEGEGSTFGFFFKVRRIEAEDEIPPEEDQLKDDEIQDVLHHQNQKRGDDVPIERVADKDTQHDLLEPPKKHLEYASAEQNADATYKNTAEVADEVAKTPSDEYAASSRLSKSLTSDSSSQRSKLTKLQKITDSEISTKQVKVNGGTENEQSKLRVLLVEDNIVNQRVLKRRLENNGLIIVTANNGREAVEAVDKLAKDKSSGNVSYDVILMDQEMPIMDGNAATKAIRKLEGNEMHIPILGVTANVREEQKEEMRTAGMDDVISKPYRIDEMIQRILSLVEQSRRS